MSIRLACWIGIAAILLATSVAAIAQDDLDQRIDKNINDWVGTYKHLHCGASAPLLPLLCHLSEKRR